MCLGPNLTVHLGSKNIVRAFMEGAFMEGAFMEGAFMEVSL
jgi:hypothetical protein